MNNVKTTQSREEKDNVAHSVRKNVQQGNDAGNVPSQRKLTSQILRGRSHDCNTRIVKVSCIIETRYQTWFTSITFNFQPGNSPNLGANHHLEVIGFNNYAMGSHQVLPTFTGTIFTPCWGQAVIY